MNKYDLNIIRLIKLLTRYKYDLNIIRLIKAN